MADEYTPTTDDVRMAWALSRRDWIGPEFIVPQFDRWLAEHDREVRVTELEAVATELEEREALEAKRRRWSVSAQGLRMRVAAIQEGGDA